MMSAILIMVKQQPSQLSNLLPEALQDFAGGCRLDRPDSPGCVASIYGARRVIRRGFQNPERKPGSAVEETMYPQRGGARYVVKASAHLKAC